MRINENQPLQENLLNFLKNSKVLLTFIEDRLFFTTIFKETNIDVLALKHSIIIKNSRKTKTIGDRIKVPKLLKGKRRQLQYLIFRTIT